MSNTDYRGSAFNPELQEIYQQAMNELSQYSKRLGRYYCDRLSCSVSGKDRVVVLETVLDALEDARFIEDAIEQIRNNADGITDIATRDRYIHQLEKKLGYSLNPYEGLDGYHNAIGGYSCPNCHDQGCWQCLNQDDLSA